MEPLNCRNCCSGSPTLIDLIDVSVKTPDNYPLSGKLVLQECLNCGFIQNKQFSHDTDYNTYYSKFYQKSIKLPSNNDDYDYFRVVANNISKLLSNKIDPKVLDFGAGNSPLKTMLQNNNIYCESIDIGAKPSNNKFDLIISTHVFEHLIDPKSTLNWFSSLLNENGLIILTVPDLNRYINYYQGPFNCFDLEHINHWDSNTIEFFIKTNGFELVKTELGLRIGNGITYPELYTLSRKSVESDSFSHQNKNLKGLSIELIDKSKNDIDVMCSLFLSNLCHSRFYFWGASTFLFRFFNTILTRQFDIKNLSAIIDINPALHGLTISDIPFISPSEFLDSIGSDEVIIFICAVRSKNILSFIDNLNLPKSVRVVNLYTQGAQSLQTENSAQSDKY